MFFEYMRLVNVGGQSTLSFFQSNTIEFIIRVLLIMLSAVAMLFIGYKIKGGWGAIIAFLICAFLFLYANGMLPI
jgi:4-hydroxybenzoate polyprenyltransferase